MRFDGVVPDARSAEGRMMATVGGRARFGGFKNGGFKNEVRVAKAARDPPSGGTRDSTILGARLSAPNDMRGSRAKDAWGSSPKTARASSPKAVIVTRSPAMFNVVFIPCMIAHSKLNLANARTSTQGMRSATPVSARHLQPNGPLSRSRIHTLPRSNACAQRHQSTQIKRHRESLLFLPL